MQIVRNNCKKKDGNRTSFFKGERTFFFFLGNCIIGKEQSVYSPVENNQNEQ
jgi:hypothetical protein